MEINEYVYKWCMEDYDPKDESFYAANARYVIAKAWGLGSLWHIIFSLAVSMLLTVVLGLPPIRAIAILGCCMIAFKIYGVHRYDMNIEENPYIEYVVSFLFLFFMHFKFAIVRLLLIPIACYMFLREIQTIVEYFAMAKILEDMIDEMGEKEKEKEKAQYKQWEKQYNQERYNLPSVSDDLLMNKAFDLFNGYTENKNALKKRYRELAKEYHPDHGGDAELFKRISTAYNDLVKKL